MPLNRSRCIPGPPALIGVLLLLCLSACGFRLAGTAELPPALASIHLETTNFEETQRKALGRSLQTAGAKLVEQAGDPQALRLDITMERMPDRELAVSGSSGTIVKRISRGLTWVLKSADGEIISPARTLRQHRDVSLSDDTLLASGQERENAIRELEQSLFQQLVRQLTRINIGS